MAFADADDKRKARAADVAGSTQRVLRSRRDDQTRHGGQHRGRLVGDVLGVERLKSVWGLLGV